MAEPAEILDSLLPDLAAMLMDSDPTVTGRMAETNATGFALDSYSVVDTQFVGGLDQFEFAATLEYAGDQNPDRPYSGDAISVSVTGRAKCSDDNWEIDEYSIKSAETNL